MPRAPSILLAVLLVAALLPAQAGSSSKIRVLVLDGQNNHDWKGTSMSLRATLNACGRFEVSTSTSPPKKSGPEKWAAWRPAFDDHQVVLCNYNGQGWPEPVKNAFLAFVANGGGVVNVHAANNSFSNWKEWNRMIALGWRNAKFGDRITVNPDTGKLVRTEKGKGPGAGHGRQHPFLVTVRDPEHPIMKGLPAWWMHTKDELYHGQRGPANDMKVLSSAWADPKTGGTGKHEPITWWVPWGKGRVVTTVLGHHWNGQKDFDALHCVGFQAVVVRALEWAATGKVTIPLPKGFPTDKKTSLVAPEKVDWGS